MNDVELMNIQMDHVQRHHCEDPNCHLVKTLKEAQKEHQAIVMNQGETFDILEMGNIVTESQQNTCGMCGINWLSEGGCVHLYNGSSED